jgi:hypothetical protein
MKTVATLVPRQDFATWQHHLGIKSDFRAMSQEVGKKGNEANASK